MMLILMHFKCVFLIAALLILSAAISADDYSHTTYFSKHGECYFMLTSIVSYNNELLLIGERLEARRYCRIDNNGLFEPGRRKHGLFEIGAEIEVRIRPSENDLTKFDYSETLLHTDRKLTYEYRSGTIIPCRSADSCTRITPIPGLKVLKYDNYWYQVLLPQVYNRPLDYHTADKPFLNNKPPVPDIDKSNEQDLDMNDESVVPNAHSPRYIPFDRKLPAKDKLAYRRMGEHLYAGYFDQYGRFLWNSREVPIPLKHLKTEEILRLISVSKINEQVYEFRSGSLIRGTIDKDFYFIPEIGSTIESFRDYRKADNPRRIYNLPGVFATE